MKLVTAVFQPHRLQDVTDALVAAGLEGITVTEVTGHGKQKGHTEFYRGAEYATSFVPKVRVDIVVEDADAEQTVDTIVATARTGRIGDGKVWYSDVNDVVRVRTGERGTYAI